MRQGAAIVDARLDRDRDGLLVFFVCIILFCVAAAVYFLTHLLVAAAPVVMLASRVTVAGPTSNATWRVVGQWGGAGGTCCEDHFCGVRRFGARGAVMISWLMCLVALRPSLQNLIAPRPRGRAKTRLDSPTGA